MSAAGEPQPPGHFPWTPAWKRALPVWRGEPLTAPVALDAQQCLAQFAAAQTVLQRSGLEAEIAYRHAAIPRYREIGATRVSLIDAAALAREADESAWQGALRALLVAIELYGRKEAPRPHTLWQLAAAAHGVVFATRQVLAAVAALAPADLPLHCYPACGFDELRERIAALPEAEYQALLAEVVAAGLRGHAATLAAHLLPCEAALVRAALDGSDADITRAALLAGCRLDGPQARKVHARLGFLTSAGHWRIALLNAVRCELADALDFAIAALPQQQDAAGRRAILDLIRAHDSPAALRWLLTRLEDREVRPHADEIAQAWPEFALREVAQAQLAQPRPALRDWLAWLARAQPAALVACQGRSEGALRELFEQLADSGSAQPEAALADLPDWLRAPPWRVRGRRALAWPALPVYAPPPTLAWRAGERERWLDGQTPQRVRERFAGHAWLQGRPLEPALLTHLGVAAAAQARALAGAPLQADDVDGSHDALAAALLVLPPATAVALLALRDPRRWTTWSPPGLEGVVAWLDEAAIPVLDALPDRHAEIGLRLAQALVSARVATCAARALRGKARGARLQAQAWLQRHAALAAATLLPQLADRKAGADALPALRWLLEQDPAALEQAAALHGTAGAAALAQLRAFDPMQLAPLRIPQMPAFWTPVAWPRPQLLDGRALPPEALDAIGEMLAISTLEQRYAGLDRLRALCRPASLGAFAWALFEAWHAGAAPGKDSWAFHALAHLGDDDCAARFARRLREWSRAGELARALAGLEVLAAIASDVALMHLNGLAQQRKVGGLQRRAEAKIAAIAQARELSREQLDDRLVPDLGLDADGSLRLDFGPRQFTVGFDEALAPYVRDGDGKRLRELPKPGRGDDAALAALASAQWKSLKASARALASLQIARLEQAMCTRRRWNAGEWQTLIVRHPLLRHLARRLLWAVYVDDRPQRCLRVAEDGSFADASDSLLTLADGDEIGLAHPCELDPAAAMAFGQQFADYEILQPFPQLGREVWRLDPAEAAGDTLQRFSGRRVASGSLLGLESRGWRRDGEYQHFAALRRALGEHAAELSFGPGCDPREPLAEPVQTLGKLQLRRARVFGDDAGTPWHSLHPVQVSEVLRDVERLTEVA